MLPGLAAQVATWSMPGFAAAFLLLALIETHRPSATPDAAGHRWVVNLSLYAGVLLCAMAFTPRQWLSGWEGGLLAGPVQHANPWLLLAGGLLGLDILSYALHRLGHMALLWRFHAVHHADTHVDLTTGLRHHPIEFFVNAVIGAAVLTALGLPAWIVGIYAPIAGVFDLWTHANIGLPPRLERALSTLIVTPGQHRIHHSPDPMHYGANFGSVLTVWDRLFGTFRPPSTTPLAAGLPGVDHQGLTDALKAPFATPSRP